MAVQNLAKFYLGHLADKTPHLARELAEFHAARVNPRDLVVNAVFFKHLVDELKSLPHVRHYMALAQYTLENSRSSAGQPNNAQFIEPSTIANLGKKRDLVQSLEGRLKAAREKFLPLLEAGLTEPLAKLELADLAIVWVRCLLAKPLGADWASAGPKNRGPAKGET